jgi:TolB-like protein/Tfp pilus assembly protein PilF
MDAAVKQFTDIEQAQVLASLAKILNSPLFAGSPRQVRFLDYLVTNSLAGNASRLKGYTIAIEVFDRTEDFDPNLDAIVRVEATRLRNKLREYYDTPSSMNGGKEDHVRIDFPKGGYALNISIKQDNPLQLIERRVNHTANLPHMVSDKPSLAVLPFANIGMDNSKEYFADGVVDSLISMLSRLSGLFVISRQSSFSYKNTTKTSKEIADDLGVRYLLEGSVQHAGNLVRVAAQLVDTQNGGHIWSDRFDRELKDIFALQDELTQSIVSILQIKLDTAEAALFGIQVTNSIEAHDYLLQAISMHRRYTEKSTTDAIELFNKALSYDPAYSAAHAWLARSLALTWSQKWNPDVRILDIALSHAESAVELSPQSPYAISILGWVYLWRRNREESIAECRRAIIIDPNNVEAQLFLSIVLSGAGYGEEALYYIEKSKRNTPTSSPFHQMALGNCYLALKDYPKAITSHEAGCAMNPNFIPCHFFALIAYEELGMNDEVRMKYEILNRLTGDPINQPAMTLWTDNSLAKKQEEIWGRVVARLSL